jgi:hypothetical protein
LLRLFPVWRERRCRLLEGDHPLAESALPQVWWLYVKPIAAWIVGPLMTYFGYYGVQTEETVIVVIAAAGVIAGPMLIVVAPFMPRPGYGPCPLCGAKMYQMLGPGEGGYLVCPRCIAYAKADGDKLSLIPTHSVSATPISIFFLASRNLLSAFSKMPVSSSGKSAKPTARV